MDKFSKYFDRKFGRFMDNLYRKRLLDVPKLKDCDIESFFIHITELKARVEELEREISLHTFYPHKPLHPHNEELLRRCRISKSDAYNLVNEYVRMKEELKNSRILIS